MGKSLFQRGYKAAREEKKKQDAARENSGRRLYNLFLKEDGDEAQVRFLTEEPINFYAHNIKTVRNGSDRYDTFTCSQDDDCPYCNSGDRPSYKGAYLLYDKREYEVTDERGKKKKQNGTIRLYIQGMRVISQLDRLSSRYGLTKFDYVIARVGKGQNTSYTFDRERDEDEKITKKEIENLLPEKLREEYDGTQESLYRIVEEQVMMMLPSNDTEEDDDEEEDYEDAREEKKRRSKVVSLEYDDEEDDDDDEDEDYEEPPRKKKMKSKSAKSILRRSR